MSGKNESNEYEVVTITAFVDDGLTEMDKSSLYRHIWKWFEDQCNMPHGLKIE